MSHDGFSLERYVLTVLFWIAVAKGLQYLFH